MKRFLVGLCIITSVVAFVIFLIIFSATTYPDHLAKNFLTQQETQQVQLHQSKVDLVVNDIKYIKDPRTNLCFAYLWKSQSNGGPGPALTIVLEEMIPPELLSIAEIESN